jgi:hypothetical protein
MEDQELLKKVDSLRVVDLRTELKHRGLKVGGNKSDLIARLREYINGMLYNYYYLFIGVYTHVAKSYHILHAAGHGGLNDSKV